MSTAQDTLARRLAEHFAPELGAALPQITELLLDGEDPYETGMRGPKLADLVGCARYLVELSVVALAVHRRLMLERAGQAGESPSFDDLRTKLLSEAPHDDEVSEPLRERTVTRVADLTVNLPCLLPHDTILALQQTAILAGPLDRQTLLSGIDKRFTAELRLVPTHGQQLLSDLDEMNAAGALADGSVPLARWLDNAVVLAGQRREAQVFAEARAALKVP